MVPSIVAAARPLHTVLHDAAHGRLPAADGIVEVHRRLGPEAGAVVAFTDHAVVVGDVEPDEVAAHLGDGGPGAVLAAPFLAWLGERLGAVPGTVDVVLAAPASTGSPDLHVVAGGSALHRLAQRSLPRRRDLRVYADARDRGVVAIGLGLADRWEATVEVDPAHRGVGLGRALAAAARHLAPAEQPLFVPVRAPHAAGLRAVAAAGYLPIGAEVVLR